MRDPIEEMKLAEMKAEIDRHEKFEEAVDTVVDRTAPREAQGGTVLPLMMHPHVALRTPCVPVERFDGELQQLVRDMAMTMYMCGGIGLAAPQVDRNIQLFVCDLRAYMDHAPSAFRVFVNPVISCFGETRKMTEACLSFPTIREQIERHDEVIVKAYTEFGRPFEVKAKGMLAQVIQHEYDHLQGTVMIDRLKGLQRQMAIKKLNKFVTKVQREARADQRPKPRRRH